MRNTIDDYFDVVRDEHHIALESAASRFIIVHAAVAASCRRSRQ
jgi:hypothetical protein